MLLYEVLPGYRAGNHGGRNVNAWWWGPIGLAAWCLVAVVMALCIGRVLRRATQVRESLDRQLMEQYGTIRRGRPLHVEAEFDQIP